MENNYENSVLDVFDKRDEEKKEFNEEVEKRYQKYKESLEKSLKKDLIDAKNAKKIKVETNKLKKRVITIAMIASLLVAGLIGFNNSSINQELLDQELERIDKTLHFTENIDAEYLGQNYPSYPYVASKYVVDIINYENNSEINKDIYYDEMVGYIYYHSKNVLDDVFKNMKSYIENNECSEALKIAFNYENFEEYLKAHNFESASDFEKQITKFLIELSKYNGETDEKIDVIAGEHHFTIDKKSINNDELGGRN